MKDSTSTPVCPPDSAHCPEAERAANYAVKKTFAIMGVDIDSPKEVSAFQDELRFGKTLNTMAHRGVLGIFSIITAIIIAYITTFFLQNK